MSVAVADSKLFAPYQVATWQAIPASQKAPDGAWVQDYGGFMSVGYNSARFGDAHAPSASCSGTGSPARSRWTGTRRRLTPRCTES